MGLIDKDKVVAEIDRRIQELHPTNTHKMQVGDKMDRDILMWLNALTWVKYMLNTIETKEVDLEKEINKWQGCEAFPEGCNITPLPEAMNIVERTANHFYELGLKAQANNVWHRYDEPIDTNRTILITSPNGKSSLALWDGKSFKTTTIDGGHNVLCDGDKWAYVDELCKFN